MFPYSRYLNAKILFTFYLRPLQNKMFCITSRRYGDNAKQHRLYYIFKQSSVFFFSICLTGCFYNDNEQAAECLNELKLDLFLFQQWKQLLFLVMKIIGIVKGLLLFVYIQYKKNLCFFVK